MSLNTYIKKRDFTKTPEPTGITRKNSNKLIFVIQRHKASHLHYDFRLELNGVLKSWAIPKGPSMNPQDKRLAMMVEDHPYDYKDFKGVIPDGYGAGIVEIWDKGTYNDVDSSDKIETVEKNIKTGLKKGNIKFILHGKKLKGEFALVKLKQEDNSWLLIKHKDKYAVDKIYDSENETSPQSPINKWLAQNKKSVKKKPET